MTDDRDDEKYGQDHLTADNNQVGYGRPPKHSQFKKGESGNPGGRRTKGVTMQEVVAKVAAQTITVRDRDGSRREMNLIEAIIQRQFADAARGDHRAVQTTLKLLDKAPIVAERPMTIDEITKAEIETITPEERVLIDSLVEDLGKWLPAEGEVVDETPDGDDGD